MRPTYVVVGHVTNDRHRAGSSTSPGGTALFAARTAQAIGCSPLVVTSFADGFDSSLFEGSSLIRIPSRETTTFLNDYTDVCRKQQLDSIASSLPLEVIPAPPSERSILHIGPVFNEIDEGVLARVSTQPWGFIGLTPQGWMRERRGTEVVPKRWLHQSQSMCHVDAAVFSDEDVGHDPAWGRELATSFPICAMTLGRHGCRLFIGGDERERVDAPDVPVVETTGAGDIFAASFFIALAAGHEPRSAAIFASIIATDSTRRAGPASVPEAKVIKDACLYRPFRETTS